MSYALLTMGPGNRLLPIWSIVPLILRALEHQLPSTLALCQRLCFVSAQLYIVTCHLIFLCVTATEQPQLVEFDVELSCKLVVGGMVWKDRSVGVKGCRRPDPHGLSSHAPAQTPGGRKEGQIWCECQLTVWTWLCRRLLLCGTAGNVQRPYFLVLMLLDPVLYLLLFCLSSEIQPTTHCL